MPHWGASHTHLLRRRDRAILGSSGIEDVLQGAEQAREVVAGQHEQIHRSEGLDGGGTRLIAQQRKLPKIAAGAQPADLLHQVQHVMSGSHHM